MRVVYLGKRAGILHDGIKRYSPGQALGQAYDSIVITSMFSREILAKILVFARVSEGRRIDAFQ